VAEFDPEPSRDTLLGGRAVLFQPVSGYRVAMDPVLLAAAVPAVAGDIVLDVGSGTGAAALALAARVPGVRVIGLDLQAPMVELAGRGAEASGLASRVRFMAGDVLDPPRDLAESSFDHVMANPPYRTGAHGSPSADDRKRAATVEGRAGLKDWLRFAFRMVRPGGAVTIIHSFDRKDEVIDGLGDGGGDIVVLPLLPAPGKDAKRVIARAVKGGHGGPVTVPGLVLHGPDGGYTPEVQAILRDAQALRV
jgi:tRNA1(Val) A37 N6-methylase TrmN6